MLERRTFVAGLAALTLPAAWTEEAHASALTGLTLRELVTRSERVALCQAVSSECTFAQVAGSRRIVTLTRLVELETVQGHGTASEHIALTLGGRIGDIGQKVHGEAILPPEAPVVVFLGSDHASSGVGFHRRIVGMAQGSFEVDDGVQGRRLRPNRNLPKLIRRKGVGPLAIEELGGRDFQDCAQLIRGAAR